MIKAGQIYISSKWNIKYVVTNVRKYTENVYVISEDGISSLRSNGDIKKFKLLAEYPTWQLAISSKEFNDDMYNTK